ncbi:hypothetical protein GJ744_001658 [Endocarpon pusillum]|uniref:Gluconokinase n=1 Tax=Endocarpon pusillum TaxID=364733 RepID=A0A8H7AGQ8_9EURO|nr:hypothetical protein GJ744_001658 [Endocarpon pusillum]
MNGGSIDQQEMKHIWVITGPAGCGKTTVAQYLMKQLSLPYVEGDDYHSKASKHKMASNIPLTDDDRWSWLIELRKEAMKRLQSSQGVIVTCSALKHRYRDVLRVAHYENPNIQVHFIYLRADRKTLQERVANRQNHYMKKEMVNSQLDNLEEPEEEEWDAMSVDVRSTPEVVQLAALEVVKKKLAEYQHQA